MSWIDESCATDLERSSWSRAGLQLLLDRDRDQLLDLLRGVAERDRLDLDRGGANSGNTSTFELGICARPNTVIAAAANTTSHRNRRLLPTIHRSAITCRPRGISSSVPYTSAAPSSRPGCRGRHPAEHRAVPLDAVDPDPRPQESSRGFAASCRRTSCHRAHRGARHRGRPPVRRCGARPPCAGPSAGRLGGEDHPWSSQCSLISSSSARS